VRVILTSAMVGREPGCAGEEEEEEGAPLAVLERWSDVVPILYL